MPSIQIKGVPDETHAVLRRRAAAAHQSLQEYLLAHLVSEAAHPTIDEVFAQIETYSGGSAPIDEVLAALDDDRARH